MKFSNKKVVIASALLSIAILGAGYIKNSNQSEIRTLEASWADDYQSIEQLVEASDLIALVKVKNIHAEYERYGIPFTEYVVEITEHIYGGNDREEVIVFMTGGTDYDGYTSQLEEDPLMKEKEEFLLFAQENDDGTFTILGGPQGRFIYENGQITSLGVKKAKSRSIVSEEDYLFSIYIKDEDINSILSEIKDIVGEGDFIANPLENETAIEISTENEIALEDQNVTDEIVEE